MSENVGFDSEIEKRPVLAAGEYGANGDAVLDKVVQRPAPWDESRSAMSFQVVVRHPEHGVVRIFQDFGMDPGSQVPKLFRQLGVTDEEMKIGVAKGDWSVRLGGTKVIATIGIREFTSKKDLDEMGHPRRHQQNTITNLVKL